MGFWEQVIKNKIRYVESVNITKGLHNKEMLTLLKNARIGYNKDNIHIYNSSKETILVAPYINSLPDDSLVYQHSRDGTIVIIDSVGKIGQVQLAKTETTIMLKLSSNK